MTVTDSPTSPFIAAARGTFRNRRTICCAPFSLVWRTTYRCRTITTATGKRTLPFGGLRRVNGHRLNSANGQFVGIPFGQTGDIPVNGDYDGDGRSDTSVYRPANGAWYRLNSSNGAFNAVQFGIAEDKPVVGDYDADGIFDLAVFRPSSGIWYLLKSTEGFGSAQFGVASDLPVPADYDGDQFTDIAVFRPSEGNWYVLRSSDGGVSGTRFGASGDRPVPAAP